MAKIDKYWLAINNKCNNQCVFCLDADNQKNGIFKPIEEVKNQIKKAKGTGAKRLVISGGEASIHPDFLDIIKFAKFIGFSEIQTITNGRMFTYKKFTRQAIKNGLTEITFSLHAYNAELHEQFTGVKGSFEQAINGLKNVKMYPNVIVNIDVVINKLNYKKIYDIIMFYANNFAIFEYDLLQIVPFGRAWENRNKLLYNLDEAMPYLQKVWELAKNDKRFHIWTNRFPAKYLEGYEFLIQDPIKIKDELSGRRKGFENYLKIGKMLNCYDKIRCQYCWLNDFCQKLISLKKIYDKNKSRFINEINKLTRSPFCLEIIKKEFAIDFIINQKFELDTFADFYINNLYKVKSLHCEKCSKQKECPGANIDLIKKKGFNILKPIK